MEYIVGIVLALVGALFWENKKRTIAEARNENLLTKEKLNDINKEMAKNSGSIESEVLNQNKIKKDLEDAKKDNMSVDDVIDIINKFKS